MLVDQQERLLARNLRTVTAVLWTLIALASLAYSVHLDGRVQPDGLVWPATFLVLALIVLLTRTPRSYGFGLLAVFIASTILNGVVGNETWSQIIIRWISTGIVILAILFIYKARRGRE